MAVRVGEMMVVIRAQDFASRTLHRVSGELAGMSRAQMLARKQMEMNVKQARIADRAFKARGQIADLSLIQRRALLEQKINDTMQRRRNILHSLQSLGPMAQPTIRADLRQRFRELGVVTRATKAELMGVLDAERALTPAMQRLSSQVATGNISWRNFHQLTRQAHTELLGATTAQKLAAEEQMMLNRAIAMAPLRKLHDIGSAMSGIGRTLQLFGAVGVATFGIMANEFAEFSASASTAATQMRDFGGTAAQVVTRSKELQQAIVSMMMTFPATGEEMTNAAYEIFSSMNLMENGVMNVKKGLGLLALANKAAVAGQVDLAEATNAMIVALNTFGPTAGSVIKTMDTLMNIVRFGKLRLSDLSKTMASFAAVAKASGLALSSVGGAFSTLTLFMEPSRAAAGLGRLIELFRVPDFRKGFEEMGQVVVKANGRMRPLLDIFKDLVRIRPDLAASQTAAVDFFIQVTKASGLTKKGIQGTVQARRAFEQLVTHMGTFAAVAGNVANVKNELDTAFEARMLDPGVQWQIFKNQLRALVIVIGREALPVFIDLGNHIAGLIRWFQNLNRGTRGTIIRIATVSAVVALFGGVLLSLGGSLTQVAANLAILRTNMLLTAAATGQATAATSLFRAALIGITKTVALGAIFILAQQILGIKEAIIVTATAWAVWRLKALQSIAFVVAASVAGAATIREAFTVALASSGWGLIAVAAGAAAIYVMNHWDQVRAWFYAFFDDIGAGFQHLWNKTRASAIANIGYIMIGFGKLRKAITGDDSTLRWGRNMVQGAEDAWNSVDDFERNYTRALKKIRSKNKDRSGFGMNWLEDVNSLASGLTSEQFRKQWEDWANTIGDNTKKAAQMAKAHTNAIQQATENMNETIQRAAQNLAGIYETLRQQNEQAMKGLFQGPTMSGILGNVFSTINDTLRQFGVQIPVPFNILKQDLEQSVTYFKRWRNDIAKLLKRGMPIEMVQQIQALGPDAGIPIAEGLLSGGKAGWKSVIAEWKSGQKLLDKATKTDMDNKLKLWNSYGEDAAWATIQGIISNPRNHQITKMYENYVKTTYGSILKKVFQEDVATYMANAIADAQAAATQAGITAPPGAPGTTRRLTRAQQLQRNILARATRIQTVNELQAQAFQQAMKLTSPGGKRIVPQEWAEIRRLGALILRLVKAQEADKRRLRTINTQQNYYRRALPFVREQMRQQKGQQTYTITYQGDTITIRADGATVASVTRALQKKHFKKKKNTRGTTVRGGGHP